MKTILIPNDLSAVAENAFAYAVDFAMAQPEKIHLVLLHVFETDLAHPYTTVELIISNMEEHERHVTDQLNAMAAKHVRATGLRCSVLTTRGFVEDEIAAMAALHQADYIFMGTKGAKGLNAILYGSNTSGVIGKAPCPVLAIPENALFSALHTIVFASDFHDTDAADLARTAVLGRLFNSTLLLLHLSQKDEEELDLRVLEFARTQLKAQTGYARIEIASLHAGNFSKGLETVLRDHNASMLVMAPRKRTFLQGLFNRSRTRQMVLRTHTPLLTLPVAGANTGITETAAGSLLEEANTN